MHWAEKYVGRPWVAGGRGPDAFDCWGLFRWIQRHHYGCEVPEVPVDAGDLRGIVQTFNGHPERRRWERVHVPCDGDGVLMRRSRHPVHVGIWLDVDGGGVLHCAQGIGVVFQKSADLVLGGWRIEGFYRFTGDR